MLLWNRLLLGFGLLHSFLVKIGAVGPTVLAVPAHDISAGRVLDSDLLARLADADAGFDDKRDEALSLLVGRLFVLRSDLP